MRKRFFFSLALVGVVSISSQIILIRELFATFYGNELSIGFILALWLLGGALGSWVIGNVLTRKSGKERSLFILAEFILGLLIPISVVIAREARTVFGIGAGEIIGLPVFFLSSLVVLLPITFCLGLLFVLGCRITFQGDRATSIGQVYTIEAAGAVLGGAITSLLFVPYLGSLSIAFIMSSLIFFSTFLLSGRRLFIKYASLTLLGLIVACTISGKTGLLDKQTLLYKWEPMTLVESKDSIYGRIDITNEAGQFNFFVNGLFLFSSNDSLSSEETAHFPLSQNPAPDNVLLVGGGTSEIMSEILKHPVTSVDYVELDPSIILSARKFLKTKQFYRLDDPRVNIINSDGRYFIKTTGKRYDAIIVNMPNPYTAQINRFYTVEFFREVRRVMSKGAVLGFSVSSSENYVSAAEALFLRTLLETATAVFPDVRIIPGDMAHFLCFDEKRSGPLDPEEIARTLMTRQIDTVYVRDYYLLSKLSEERQAFLQSAIRRAPYARKNFDFYPVCYFYDMVLWSTRFDTKISGFLMYLTKRRILFAAISAYFLLFIFYFLRRRGVNYRKRTTLLALFTTGLSEISYEILIILVFQIMFGYLYYKVGIIVTSFMLGLALGSGFITKKLPFIKQPFRTYKQVQLLAVMYPIVLLGAFKTLSILVDSGYTHAAQALFAGLPFIAGFVGGMQYPLANRICLEGTTSMSKIAGTTYAADLLGSFAGAFLISAFLVPIVGIPIICILLSTLSALSLILLSLSTPSS